MLRPALPVLLPLLVLCGCATLGPAPRLAPVAPRDAAALQQAADAFYAAPTAAGLKQALAAAERAGAGTALFHELAAQAALLEGREEEAFAHLEAALLDPEDDAPLFHLQQLVQLAWTPTQWQRAERLMATLAAHHPSHEVRASAAYWRTLALSTLGQEEAAREALEGVHGKLPLAAVGGWDNDQNKGFDLELPPERELDLAATYEGALKPISWQRAPAPDALGRLDLWEHLVPARHALAFLTGAFRLEAPAQVELRLRADDAVRVWVDGQRVFEARNLRSDFEDQLVLPLSLSAGPHRILVKSGQLEGSWLLSLRVTGPQGAPLTGFTALAPDAATPAGEGKLPEHTLEALVAARVASLPEGPRRAQLHAEWTQWTVGGAPAVAAADALAATGSLVGRLQLAGTLWDNEERGRTADVLAALDKEAGEALPLVRLWQARFWQQGGLKQKAREALLGLTRAHPRSTAATLQLATLFEAEGWQEDRCNLLEGLAREGRAPLHALLERVDCELDLRREVRAEAALRETLAALPGARAVLSTWHGFLEARGRLPEAIAVARRHAALEPSNPAPRLQLAESLRRAGRSQEAVAALREALALRPDDAQAYEALGHLSYQEGRREEAVGHWRAALERQPDNERLLQRLDFLAPETPEPWARDVPDEAALAAAMDAARTLKPLPGADLAWLLDDEVVVVRPDGSSTYVTTIVAQALSTNGRDRLLRHALRRGRQRVFHAFAVDPDGRRSEATSVRGGQVRFRALQPGSIVVLQYRTDASPRGFLSRYLRESFTFQGLADQRVKSRLVVWMPKGSPLHEVAVGPLQKSETQVGEQTRLAWELSDMGPVGAEPQMPRAGEVLARVELSGVPTWADFERWEKGLLEDALRDSPESDAVAARLGQQARTPWERLLAVHRFVTEEVRYEQDYESVIAGVRPHPASMTLERRYGDCKDKAILFITLARKLGLDVHYALIRTRDQGPVRQELPLQQFNHAVVYVPPQEGIPEGRFFDSTADGLDLTTLRHDVAGTLSLVLDTKTGVHTWREVGFQPSSAHASHTAFSLTLEAEGAAAGRMELSGVGRLGGALRLLARNPERLEKATHGAVGGYFPGASVTSVQPQEVKDLGRPAAVAVEFRAPAAGRREGDSLRVRPPADRSLQRSFALSERRHPLLLSVPSRETWSVELAAPASARLLRAPADARVEGRCFTFTRQVAPRQGGLTVTQSLESRCERIAPADYATERRDVERISRLMEEEVVFRLAPERKAPARVSPLSRQAAP